MPDAVPDNTLMTAFGFTAADLAANRAGNLSERQASTLARKSLQHQLLRTLQWSAFALLFFAAGVLEILAGIWAVPVIIAALMFALAGFFGYMGWRNWQVFQRGWRAVKNDRQAGTVTRVTGPIALDAQEGHPPRFFATIEGHRFVIPERAALALHRGGVYTAYYAPEIETLLSIEPGEPAP